MKNFNIKLYGLVLLAAACLVSCDINNIGKDENGDDISLLRLDLPKFDATYLMNFVDENGQLITSDLNISFAGKNGNSLVTEAGRINETYRVVGGMLNLNLNPNIKINSQNQIDFQIKGAGAGMVVLPYIVKQSLSGERIINVEVFNWQTLQMQQSTISKNRATSPITVTTPDHKNLSPLAVLSGKDNGNGYEYKMLYMATVSGEYTCLIANAGEYDSWGIYTMSDDMTSAPKQSLQLNSGDLFTVVTKAKNLLEGKIKVQLNSGSKTSISVGYTVEAGGRTYRGTLNGITPLTTAIEQIYVPSSDKKAKITFYPTAPYKLDPSTIDIADVTTAGSKVDATITTNAASPMRRYDLDLIGYCATDKSLTYAITKTFQYSLGSKEISDDARQWNNGALVSGKASFYMIPNQRYTFRISVNNKWYKYDITTNPKDIYEIMHQGDAAEYVSKYEMTENTDGSYNLKVEITNDELCDL